MSKKLLSVGVVLALVAAVLVSVPAVSAQSMSLCQTVDALVVAGVIAPDKVAAAKAAAGCTATASASYTFTKDLTVGSTGADVTALQNKLGVTPATGYFGSITKAAVIAYQTSKGISATGYVGPMTRAALNAAVVVVPTTPVTPVTPATPSTSLDGSAGDLSSVKEFTSNIKDVVAEDSSENVLGAELEAGTDSDLAITSMKLSLVKATGASASTRLDRYVDSVKIMQGSKEVASVDAADFTKSGTTYSKSITLSNAVVKADAKSKFYVVVNTVSSIDSQYDRSATWTVTLNQTRYKDASGAFLTDSTSGIAATFGFESVTANDKITLQSSTANPVAGNLKVSDVDTSDDFTLLAFKLKADVDSTDLNVITVPVVVTITSASSTSYSSEDLINDIWLKVGSDTYTDFDNTAITVATTSATSTTYTFNIDAGDLQIAAGDTAEVKVVANLGKQDKYQAGTKISAKVLASTIEVENTSGDSVTSPTNSAIGNDQTVQLEGVNFTLKTPSVDNSSETNGVDPYVTVVMPLQISTDETLYVLKNATATAVARTLTGIASASTTVSFTTGSNIPNIVNNGSNDYYEINGTSVVYVKFIVNGNDTGAVGNVNIALTSVAAATEMGGSTVSYTLSPTSSFDVDATLRK